MSVFLTYFQMSLTEVLEDLIDPDKAGNGVRGLREALGTFPETFVKIKNLEPCLRLFRESWRTFWLLTKLEMVSRG